MKDQRPHNDHAQEETVTRAAADEISRFDVCGTRTVWS